MSKYIFTGMARVSDIDEMINIMFTKDKIYNANLFRKMTIPILKEGLSTLYKINNEIAGFICLTKKENNEILIISLFVSEKYRRQGIAKKLLSMVIDEAREYGCKIVQITASDMGVLLYSDFGFVKNNNFMQYKL